MKINEIISAKQNNQPLTKEEISYFVKGFLLKEISDEDMTLLLKAIQKNGMTTEETINYTQELIDSGDSLPLKEDFVDKHSSGGVGDKVSIILLPILAAMGLKILKISGRALGFTGGTVDKLESLPNFNVSLNIVDALKQVDEYGLALTGQTPNLTPADKAIYALRDVTGTVNSIPLIAASIMSKKIATGAKNILIDLKVGSGAFIKSVEEGKVLGKVMKEIGEALDRNVFILFTSMDSPLGEYVGNANEVYESYKFLKGKPSFTNLHELVKKIAIELYSKSKGSTLLKAEEKFNSVIENREALETFYNWIEIQGASREEFTDRRYFKPRYRTIIKSPAEGYLSFKNVNMIGELLIEIGAGRRVKDEEIDSQVGIKLLKQPGDMVKKYDDLFIVYSTKKPSEDWLNKMLDRFTMNENEVDSSIILGELPW